MADYECEANLPKSKYGLREYSFEIGPMDDTSEAVAIVGIEYSSVSWDEKFYRKEDVDALLAEKEAELNTARFVAKTRVAAVYKQLKAVKRALYKALANWALAEFRILDMADQGEPHLWYHMWQRCKEKIKDWKD